MTYEFLMNKRAPKTQMTLIPSHFHLSRYSQIIYYYPYAFYFAVRKNLELDIMVPLGEPFLVGRMVFLVKFGTFFDSIIFCNRFEMDFSVSGFKPENMVSKSLKCVVVFSSSAASLLT